MSGILSFFGLLAMAAVAVVLVMGLWNLARGGSGNRSQSLMRLRVMLQFVAIVALMGFLWASGR